MATTRSTRITEHIEHPEDEKKCNNNNRVPSVTEHIEVKRWIGMEGEGPFSKNTQCDVAVL